MKPNEAPEKIYIPTILAANTVKYKEEGSIEYIRTDAFIEKACEYMRNHIDPQLTIYHEQTWKKRDEFIRNFKRYMKGE